LEAASTGSSNGGQQQQIAELKQLLSGMVAAQHAAAGSSNGGSSGGSSSGSSGGGSWLEGVLHQLGAGPVSGGPDPDAGAALMSSVVSVWLAAASGCAPHSTAACQVLSDVPALCSAVVAPHAHSASLPVCLLPRPPSPAPQAPDPRLAVLEGPAFRALVLRPDGTTDLDAFAALWPHIRVMARCTPADKFTLVQVRAGGGCFSGRNAVALGGVLWFGAGLHGKAASWLAAPAGAAVVPASFERVS
jgi:hypothetical protein